MRISFLIGLCFTVFGLAAQEAVDTAANSLIRKHGLEQSQVMDLAEHITDIYGPRLTGSPGLDRATEWAQKRLQEMGLTNVHLEAWGPFGRGWELQHFELHASTPQYWPVLAYPKAWSPSASGTGEVIYLQADDEASLERYRGKLKGKIVLLDTIRNTEEWFEGLAQRYEPKDLLDLANASLPTPRPRRSWRGSASFQFNQLLWKTIGEEKPLLVLDRAYKGDLGTVFVSGARASGEGGLQAYNKEATVVPQATLAVEHYNRLLRLLQRGVVAKLTLDMKARYTNDDGMEHNIIAEIPGTDLKEEVVMFGAHFDSWHAATGATDNGAGSAVMMEVARILQTMVKETGQQPRRTLRLALWTGEEQGLYGSINYVREHFAETEPNSYTPKRIKPEQEKVSAYYNLDNGTGKVRGIYLQGNEAVGPIFRAWLEPFKDLETGTLTLGNTGGTDHLGFDGVGIPGFQFIQDPMAYFARTHHSNMDNLDHLVEADLKQAATIIASMVWHTAQRDEKLPRKPLMMDTEAETGSN